MEQLAENTPETPTAELRTPPHHHKVSRKARLSFPTPDYSKVKPRVQFPRGQYKPPEPKNKAPLSFPTPDYSKGLCHLSETLDSLVKSFLLTKKELRRLKKQHRADLGCLDPTRSVRLRPPPSLFSPCARPLHEPPHRSSQSSCFPGPVPSTTRTTTRTRTSSSSSSSSRRRRIIPGERRSSKVQSQDGIVSPELDTSFIRSESSPLPPTPVHQMATESVRLFRCDSIESISAEESSRNPPSVFHPPTNARTAQQEKSGRSRSLYCSSPQRVTCSSISSISSRMRSNVQPPALMSRSTQTSAAVERSSRTPQHRENLLYSTSSEFSVRETSLIYIN
ncbi:uncharacterized protein LOC114460733 [Gouania willdenowi]|uniref:uncharacterized protein LOC114460733 n=1 Tax=Gouania willdenowi TaxID=441366 RepID=UPI001056A51C|nr:uncharacterized protein LOC114460733 [Gouania willdenowi]